MKDAVIVATARTGIGKAGRGTLNLTHGATMGGHVAGIAVARAGIDPASSVAADDPNSELAEPYINVFTVSGDDLDNETYEKIVDVWQSEEVTAALNEDSNGTAVQVQRSKEDLNEILDRLVEEYK